MIGSVPGMTLCGLVYPLRKPIFLSGTLKMFCASRTLSRPTYPSSTISTSAVSAVDSSLSINSRHLLAPLRSGMPTSASLLRFIGPQAGAPFHCGDSFPSGAQIRRESGELEAGHRSRESLRVPEESRGRGGVD